MLRSGLRIQPIQQRHGDRKRTIVWITILSNHKRLEILHLLLALYITPHLRIYVECKSIFSILFIAVRPLSFLNDYYHYE